MHTRATQASRSNQAAVQQLENVERRYQAAQQKSARGTATADSASLLAGMLLCNAGAMAIGSQRGVNVVERARAERELALCDVGTYAIVVDCNTHDFPLLLWTVERVDAPAAGSKAIALFDRAADEHEHELPLRKGDVVTILAPTREVGWWKASALSGRVGLVPSNFLQLKTNEFRASVVLPRALSRIVGSGVSLVMRAELCCDANAVWLEVRVVCRLASASHLPRASGHERALCLDRRVDRSLQCLAALAVDQVQRTLFSRRSLSTSARAHNPPCPAAPRHATTRAGSSTPARRAS